VVPYRYHTDRTASESNALNLGDEGAVGFPRFYMDADIKLTPGAIDTVSSRMAKVGAVAAAPAMEMRLLVPSLAHTAIPAILI